VRVSGPNTGYVCRRIIGRQKGVQEEPGRGTGSVDDGYATTVPGQGHGATFSSFYDLRDDNGELTRGFSGLDQ